MLALVAAAGVVSLLHAPPQLTRLTEQATQDRRSEGNDSLRPSLEERPQSPPGPKHTPAQGAAEPTAPRKMDSAIRQLEDAQTGPASEADQEETGSLPVTPGESYAAYLQVSADNEDQALALTIKMQRKYASVLAPRRLSYKGFKAGDGYDFRVRLARLTHDEAQAVCRRVREEGGACKVGPN